MNDLVEFLTARLDEDEQWALAASAPYRFAKGKPPVPVAGLHWTWGAGEYWVPVVPDPALDECIRIDDDFSCMLISVEEWESESVGMMPRSYAGTIEEMDVSAARHIARHDPARVLREVEAKRRTLDRHRNCGTGRGFCDDGGHGIDDVGCNELIDLAAPYDDHPDYREEWRP